MNLTHEYNIARTHARNLDLTFIRETSVCNGTTGPRVHLFENVIRYLGGFLSAYEYVASPRSVILAEAYTACQVTSLCYAEPRILEIGYYLPSLPTEASLYLTMS